VEDADPLWCEVGNVDLQVFDPGAERAPRQLEPSLGPPSWAAPAVVVRGQHAPRAAPLRLEREEAVPGADVEHRQSVQSRRQGQLLEQAGVVRLPARDYPVA